MILKVNWYELCHALGKAMHLKFLHLHFFEGDLLLDLPSDLLPLVGAAHVVQVGKVQFNLEEVVSVQVLRLHIDFGTEQHNIVDFHFFFAISN